MNPLQHWCCIVIPVYREHLIGYESFNLRYSYKNLREWDTVILSPSTICLDHWTALLPTAAAEHINAEWFSSLNSYSALCLNPLLYEKFRLYKYILILQPDAIILKDELYSWLNLGYDYIGAPIGANINVHNQSLLCNMLPENSFYRRMLPKGTVGNGGLSLRNVESCLRMIHDHSNVVDAFIKAKIAEDIFFMFCGVSSLNFRVPNESLASRFSIEHDAESYMNFHRDLPFGLHAWERLAKDYWLSIFEDFNVNIS